MGDFTLTLRTSPLEGEGTELPGVKMEKLVCDKCGFELTEPEDINLAIDGWKPGRKRSGSAAVNQEGSSPVNISRNAGAKCNW
jgi:hypothetical protein